MAGVSTVFTVKLCILFGDTPANAALFAIVGLGIEAGKIIVLYRWRAVSDLTRAARWANGAIYISVAVFSGLATILFGVSVISHQEMMAEAGASKSTETVMHLADAEKRLAVIEKYDPEPERKSIDRQIEALREQIPNITVQISERTAAITADIGRLQRERNALGRSLDTEKQSLISQVGELRREKARLVGQNFGVLDAISTVAVFFNIRPVTAKVRLMIFLTVAIELFMAISAGLATSQSPSNTKNTLGHVKGPTDAPTVTVEANKATLRERLRLAREAKSAKAKKLKDEREAQDIARIAARLHEAPLLPGIGKTETLHILNQNQ